MGKHLCLVINIQTFHANSFPNNPGCHYIPFFSCFLFSAVINQCGFNSEGILVVAKRLGAQHGKRKMEETSSSTSPPTSDVKQGGKAGPGILGVNLGKNKTSEDAASDYVHGVHNLSQYADYLVSILCFNITSYFGAGTFSSYGLLVQKCTAVI
jgi:dihydroorotate dehydrogenase